MNHLMGKRLFLLGTIFFFSADVFAACIQNPNLKNIQARIPNKTYSIQYDDIGTRVLDEFQINYANGPITTFSGNDGRCGNASITANYTNGWLPNANKIAQTNIAGIGIQVKFAGIGALNTTYFEPKGPKWQFLSTSYPLLDSQNYKNRQSNAIRKPSMGQDCSSSTK